MKVFSSNISSLVFILNLISLFFLISTKEESKRTIFDETYIKGLKLKKTLAKS